jgi:hypothetical protein
VQKTESRLKIPFYFYFCNRTLGAAWISMLKVHENIGAQRMKFAAAISDSAEDLLLLSKHIEKDRKKVRIILDDTGQLY